MAVSAIPFGQSFKGLGLGRFDFSTHTFKMMLTDSGYTPDLDTHEFKSHVTGEVSGPGYVGGGATLTGLTWAYDDDADWCVLRCDPVIWPAASFSTRYGVIYRNTGTAATSPLLSLVDFGGDNEPDNFDYTVTFTNGVYRLRNP